MRLAAVGAELARLCGGTADLFISAERAVDARHLTPNRPLLALFETLARRGKRVVATSDTWYCAEDLAYLLERAVGAQPFAAIYASADLGATKHAGDVFALIAAREGVAPDRILHVGDDPDADFARPRAAGWRALHLPRAAAARRARRVSRALYAATHLREVAGE